jgi:hypothetical protein
LVAWFGGYYFGFNKKALIYALQTLSRLIVFPQVDEMGRIMIWLKQRGAVPSLPQS